MDNYMKERLIVSISIVVGFIVLIILMSFNTDQVHVSEGKGKEIWYRTSPSSPASVQIIDNGNPLRADEMGEKIVVKKDKPKKFKKIKGCPWSRSQQKQIKKICNKYNMSFSLIMSMAYTESRFNEKAVGDGGQAYGAWQIHPSTWYQTISKLGYCKNDMLKLLPAAETVCYIMRAHFRNYDNIFFAIMAWNGGSEYAYQMIDNCQVSEYALEIEARADKYEKSL